MWEACGTGCCFSCRTKWKHLAAEDTTNFESPWAQVPVIVCVCLGGWLLVGEVGMTEAAVPACTLGRQAGRGDLTLNSTRSEQDSELQKKINERRGGMQQVTRWQGAGSVAAESLRARIAAAAAAPLLAPLAHATLIRALILALNRLLQTFTKPKQPHVRR